MQVFFDKTNNIWYHIAYNLSKKEEYKMSINLKEIQSEKIEKVVNILNAFGKNVTNNEDNGFIEKSFKIFSPENIEQVIEQVGCSTLINYMTIHSDSFSAKTAVDVLMSPKIKDISEQVKMDFIDCHLSNLKEYGKNKTYELFFENEKEKIIKGNQSKEKDTSSLVDLFTSKIRQSVYNINIILQETTPAYDRNLSINFFVLKFREFFESEKKEILSQNKGVRLYYSGADFNYDMLLNFVEKLQVSSDDEVIEVLTYIVKKAVTGKDKDNVDYIIYLLSSILQKTKEDIKKDLLNLFETSDIISAIIENEFVLNELNKDNLVVLKYYISKSNTKKHISQLINRMNIIERKDNGVVRESFNFIMKNETLLDELQCGFSNDFVEYGFEKICEIFINYLNEYTSYNFNYIEPVEGENLNILMLMKDDNIYRNISLMYNYVKIFKSLTRNEDENKEKTRKWMDIFKESKNIYLNMFRNDFSKFAINLILTCEQSYNIDFLNISEKDYETIKLVAKIISDEFFTIPAKDVVLTIESTLKNDWELFLIDDDGRMYFEILNKLRFLGKKTIDVLEDDKLNKDIKNLFISKQIILYLNNSEDYILDMDISDNLYYEPEFSEKMVSTMVNSSSWGEDGYRNMYSLNKKIPMRVKIDMKEFFNLCYFMEEIKNYKRRDIKELIIEVFKNFVNFDMSKKEFFKKNLEYNNPLFEDIIDKYIK